MAISDSTVAIIGTSNIGGALAADFAAGGLDFLLAGRDQETARKIASGGDQDGSSEGHLTRPALAPRPRGSDPALSGLGIAPSAYGFGAMRPEAGVHTPPMYLR